jgi:hypothetical protein
MQGMISIKTLSKLAQLRHEGVMLVCNHALAHMYVAGQVKHAASGGTGRAPCVAGKDVDWRRGKRQADEIC